MRFFWKLMLGMTLVVAATAWVADLSVSNVVDESRVSAVQQRVREDAWLVGQLLQPLLQAGDELAVTLLADRLARQLPGRRVTLIAPEGRVLADSHEDPAGMDNHGTRPEVLQPGSVHERHSDTLGQAMVYASERVVDSSGVLLGHARVALAASDLDAAGAQQRRALLTGTLVSLLVGLVLALLISGRISRPLAAIARAVSALGRGELHEPVADSGSLEIRQVASAVNGVARTLGERAQRISAEIGQKVAILSAMDEGLLALDSDGLVVLINEAGRALLGADGRELLGRPLTELGARTELVKAATGCLAGGQRQEGELRAHELEDEQVLHFVASPVLDESGRAAMAVLVVRDVTDLRRLEQVRRDFVANVSHELKTPLTTMRGYLEAVLDDPDMAPEQRTRFLVKAGASTARLAAIVSDLLDLARLERRAGDLDREPLDLRALVADCVRSTSPDAEDRGVVVRLHSPQGALTLCGDEQALMTAVTNLLDNGIKYSPVGGQLQVGLEREGSHARIWVADQGPGIPYEFQERIFERFYRVDKDRSRQLGGTGLGLSIVKNVVQAHGGEVWVESTPGAGSRFLVRLPLEEVEALPDRGDARLQC